MNESIVISDLANPVLTDPQREALALTKQLDVSFEVAGILAEATGKLALDDFGPEDFRRRLQLLCDEWGSDDGLTNIGRLSLRNKLVQYSRNRLLIHDTLKRHPEIQDEVIDRPIIVCGLPRSGTTHLVNLLAADARLRSLPLWESYEPVPSPLEKPRDDGVDPRYQRCLKQWETTQLMMPLLAAMHPMNPDHIHEELELMGPDFASYNFEWLSMSPRWRDDYLQHDQTPHYEYMKSVLKLLQWQDRLAGNVKQRWVLKCPQHLEQLPVLRQIFPDATLAVTHRDPVAVIQSAITMLAYGQRMNRNKVLMPELLAYWTDRIERLLRSCVRDRALWPTRQSVDIAFHELIADDLGAVEKIYDLARLPMTTAARLQHHVFLEQNRENYGRVRYDLENQFGVRTDELRGRFDFYFQAFPLLQRKG
jgi:hypothetical protein